MFPVFRAGWYYIFRRIKLNVQGSSRVLIVIALFVCFITLSIISLFLSRLLLGNLVKLSNVISIVKRGNLNATADIKSSDEIGELASNFNEMITNIKNLMESVKKANLAEKEAIYKALDNQIKPHFLCKCPGYDQGDGRKQQLPRNIPTG